MDPSSWPPEPVAPDEELRAPGFVARRRGPGAATVGERGAVVVARRGVPPWSRPFGLVVAGPLAAALPLVVALSPKLELVFALVPLQITAAMALLVAVTLSASVPEPPREIEASVPPRRGPRHSPRPVLTVDGADVVSADARVAVQQTALGPASGRRGDPGSAADHALVVASAGGECWVMPGASRRSAELVATWLADVLDVPKVPGVLPAATRPDLWQWLAVAVPLAYAVACGGAAWCAWEALELGPISGLLASLAANTGLYALCQRGVRWLGAREARRTLARTVTAIASRLAGARGAGALEAEGPGAGAHPGAEARALEAPSLEAPSREPSARDGRASGAGSRGGGAGPAGGGA